MNLQSAQCVTNDKHYEKIMKVINLIGECVFFISRSYLNSLNCVHLGLFFLTRSLSQNVPTISNARETNVINWKV
jgi:hypothetical protein